MEEYSNNLGPLIRERFPSNVLELLERAGVEAGKRGGRLYLVGGAVRDLLLGRATFDLDLVVEGDAIALAEQLASQDGGRLTVHRRFGTAKWRLGHAIIDLAMSRSETYSRPGALPTVRPGPIEDDLFRRDFTVNAIAAHLSPDCFGEVLDPYRGKADLDHRLIRILHDKSFIDDATRILRAIRYEQRLAFRLEPETEDLLRRDVPMLDTISADRLRHELDLILQEEAPEHILLQAEELGILKRLHPALKADSWLKSRFARVRSKMAPGDRPPVYLFVLTYRFALPEAEAFIAGFKIPRGRARDIRDVIDIRAHSVYIARRSLRTTTLCRLLRRYSPDAIRAVSVISKSAVVRRRLDLYLRELRHVAPSLTGKDLQKLGIPPGPLIGEALSFLRDAVLDNKVSTKEEESGLLTEWLAGKAAKRA